MSNLIAEIEKTQLKADAPQFNVGDTVRVHFRIVEGDKERIQVFEGVVIARANGKGAIGNFTVRRVSYNEGVERVFPLHSPRVDRVEVLQEGDVCRAKLHYLRERSGKAARVKQKGFSGKIAASAETPAAAVDEAPVEATETESTEATESSE